MEQNRNSSESKPSSLFSDEAIRNSEFFKDVRHLRFDDELAVDDEFVEVVIDTEEVEWQARYEALFYMVSAGTIGRMIGTNRGWVNDNAKLLGVEPVLTEDETKHAIHGYKKELILELREIFRSVPLQGDWISSLEIENRTGMTHKRVQQVLADKGIVSERRRAEHNHREARFYPPEAEDIINNFIEALPPPSGDWKTEPEIARIVGKDEDWVHLRAIAYRHLAEERTASNGHATPHHSPEVVALFVAEAEKDESYPVAAAEDVATRSLAKSVKHADVWVTNRLPYTKSEVSTKRSSVNNRPYTYVTPNPRDDLIDMPADVLEMEPAAYFEVRREWIAQETELLDIRKTTLDLLGHSLKNRLIALKQERAETRAKSLEQAKLTALRVPYKPPAEIKDDETDSLSWQNHALCRETDPEAFFPEKGGSSRDAKRVCASCKVATKCLEYALDNDERFGVWGGLSERERRKLRPMRTS